MHCVFNFAAAVAIVVLSFPSLSSSQELELEATTSQPTTLAVSQQPASQDQDKNEAAKKIAPEADWKKSAPEVDWKKDEVCRLVFFAVLEGLYQDGVSDEVVDNIIGKKSASSDKATMQEKMMRSFVMDCPLCQPTFEAFLAYQNRPDFNDGSGANTFGEGLDAKAKSDLLSDVTQTRLMALQIPVQRWIGIKLKDKNLSPKLCAQWTSRIGMRYDEGQKELGERMAKDENYKDWSGYWGCAACRASQAAASQTARTEKK